MSTKLQRQAEKVNRYIETQKKKQPKDMTPLKPSANNTVTRKWTGV